MRYQGTTIPTQHSLRVRDLPQEWLDSLCDSVQILIITAANVENTAVRDALEPLTSLAVNGNPAFVDFDAPMFFRLGLLGGYLVAHSHLMQKGDAAVPFTMERAKQTFPNIGFAVMPGIAFGLHSKLHDQNALIPGEQEMGDILVATHILDTKLEKPTEETVNHILVQQVAQETPDFERSHRINVEFGGFLAVSEVLDDTTKRMDMKTKYAFKDNNIWCVGGEMESKAVHNAEKLYTLLPGEKQLMVLIAKAICDWGFNKPRPGEPGRPEHEPDRRQAAENSTRFVKYLFADRKLPEVFKIARFVWTPPSRPAEIRSVPPNENQAGSNDPIESGIVRKDADPNSANDVGYWVRRLTSQQPALRVLIVNGSSGRGKTYFARQIRQELLKADTVSRHAWLDCTSKPPSPKTLCDLLITLLPESKQYEFRGKFKPESEEDTEHEEFAFSSNMTQWLAQELLGPGKPPLYLYMDDLDRYADALGTSGHALTSFLSTFLGEYPSLRVIATSRSADLDQRFEEFLDGMDAQIDETGNALRRFTMEESGQYLTRRLAMGSLVTAEDITPHLAAFGGDPLTLKLFTDEAVLLRKGLNRNELLTMIADAFQQRDEALKQGLAGEEADNPSIFTLRNQLFKRLFNRLPAKDANIARTLASMTDLKFNPFILRGDREWETLLPQWIAHLNPTYTLPEIKTSLLALGRGSILRPGTMRFEYDPAHEYLVEQHKTPDVRAELHTQISKLFAENHLTSFDVWHQLRAATRNDGKTDPDKLNNAFRALYTATLALEAEERNLELLQLYQEFRKRLWKQQGWQWAFVQLKLAGILYAAFDLTYATEEAEFEGEKIPIQNEGELNLSGLQFFGHNPNLLKAPDSDTKFCSILHNVYAQGRLLPPIHAFENSESMIFDERLRPTPKGERQNVALTESIQESLDDFQKYDILISKPLLAHFYNFQGCFFNGGGSFDAAVAAYERADATLRAYQKEIAQQGITLKEAQQMQFREDYLDIANNWSRTRFLQHGPQAALNGSAFTSSPLARFEALVQHETQINDKYSYAYSLIDLCYYYMALNGDALTQMRSYLNSAYKPSQRPAALPAKDTDRRVTDHWTEAYFDALEAAYKFYHEDGQDSDKIHETIDLLTQSGDRFAWDKFGYARDYLMIHCNIPLLKMAATAEADTRRALVPEFKAKLEREIEIKAGEDKPRTILDEPIVADFLLYLEACAAAKNGVPADDGNGPVATTKRRFPGLLGEGSPTFLQPGWKPPILLRGALQMITVTHTPQPWELNMSLV